MLSAAASNTLLKTLEEPPAHVVFVLATTDPQKVLPTIRSRTQHFEFTLLSHEELTGHLVDILAREGVEADAEVLDLVVRRAAGSARDALSLLDQALAVGGGHARRRPRCRPRWAGHPFDLRLAVLEAVAGEDVAGALVGVHELLDAGPRRPPRRRRSAAHAARRVPGVQRGRPRSLRRARARRRPSSPRSRRRMGNAFVVRGDRDPRSGDRRHPPADGRRSAPRARSRRRAHRAPRRAHERRDVARPRRTPRTTAGSRRWHARAVDALDADHACRAGGAARGCGGRRAGRTRPGASARSTRAPKAEAATAAPEPPPEADAPPAVEAATSSAPSSPVVVRSRTRVLRSRRRDRGVAGRARGD